MIRGWEDSASSVTNSPASVNSREKGVTYCMTSTPSLMLLPGMLVTIQWTYILGLCKVTLAHHALSPISPSTHCGRARCIPASSSITVYRAPLSTGQVRLVGASVITFTGITSPGSTSRDSAHLSPALVAGAGLNTSEIA